MAWSARHSHVVMSASAWGLLSLIIQIFFKSGSFKHINVGIFNSLSFLFTLNDITDCWRSVQSFIGHIQNPKEGGRDLQMIHRLR